MNVGNDCLYHGEHAWVKRAEGDEVIIGLSDFAQDTLGEIVDVSPPFVGGTITIGVPFGTLESRKTVTDLIAPISGVVIEINNALTSAPILVNDDPYGKGWIARIKISNPDELELLMDFDKYQATIGM